MKKNRTNFRRSSAGKASRAERRGNAARRNKLRRPSASVVPLNVTTDSCEYFLAAGAHSEKPVPGAIDPLDALDPPFRQRLGWTKVPGSTPKLALDTSVVMRRPEPEIASGSGLRFVAIDPLTYRGAGFRDREAQQTFWGHQLNGRPFSVPFVKSGIAIWKKLGIKVPTDTTAYMMKMTGVDEETSQAIQAAIWSAYNTARGPIDLETVVFALATFMHADPLRKHLVLEDPYLEPYGDRTRYVLYKVYDERGAAADRQPTAIARDADKAGRAPSTRCLPIEADNALREKIKADSTINPDHLGTLAEMKLLLASDAEKARVFPNGLGDEARAILDDLLQLAIDVIEHPDATVVGLVNELTLRVLDIRAALKAHELMQFLRGHG
jgi:hypothetical protein